MAENIGYNDGIAAMFNRLRDLDPAGTILKKDSKGKWPPIESLASTPIDQWKAYDKGQRCLEILKADHDAGVPVNPNPPDPPNPPVQTYVKVAPRVANETDRGDQRFCMFNPDGSMRPGVSRLSNGQYTDESSAKYASDGDGLEDSGVRSHVHVDGLVGSDSIDGRPYCSLPMVGDPTKNTGSWTV